MRVLRLLLLLGMLLPLSAAASPKVIVLGFDGADARLTEKWMNEGKLPNLARLRQTGTFRYLRPTIPAQTPVSWSTFSTGIDPGRTGIFDFLRRDPKTYLPMFAAFDETTEPFLLGKANAPLGAIAVFVIIVLISVAAGVLARRGAGGGARSHTRWVIGGVIVGAIVGAGAFLGIQKYIPVTRPGVVNRRQGIPFWEVVGGAGNKTSVVQIPVTFPAHDFPDGHLLSGLGVPDISGRVGKPFYFTSELDFHRADSSNEFSVEIVQLEDNKGVIDTTIQGPPNKLFSKPPYISIPMRITVANDRNSIQIEVSGQKLTLQPGQWSGWVQFVFPFNPLIKLYGISRFHLISSKPEVRLYLSPINFDPRHLPPGFKISAPSRWAQELAEKFGLYKTIGWQIDTWAISEGFADEQMFWDDMNWTVAKDRKIFDSLLYSDNDLVVQQFEFPDRVGHVFWRLIDPQHPDYDPVLAAKWGSAIEHAYELMDSIVGDAMRAADKDHAALIVLSDHGFTSFRRAVNYNTWLVENGYLVLKSGVQVKAKTVEMLFDQGQFWENVDWSKSRAYAMGLGEIYINLKGREAQGIVNPGAEYDALKRELEEKLPQMVDPVTGEHPVRRVLAREQIYSAFDPNLCPDLFVTNNAGYRVSWQTSLGGIPKDLIEVNKQVWSGDHCSVDPDIVNGIFFYNRKLTTNRQPYVGDIYPTVLGLFGLKAPYRLDGVELK